MSADVLNGMIPQAANWVWQTSIAAAGVAFLIALFQLVFRKALPPRLRLALWWLVAIRLMIPFPLSSSLSIWNLFKPSVPLPPQGVGALPNRQPDMPVLTAPATQFRLDVGSRSVEWITIASYVWLAGALISLGVVLCQHRKLAAWVRQQPSIDRFDDILSEALSRMRIRRDVRVVETCLVGTPAVFGVLHPHILIPRHLLQTLNREELRLVILHELAHIRRLDVLQNWVLIVLQSVYWFNPAVWLSFRQLLAEREFVCDAEVLAQLGDERKLYGSTLIQIASSALPTRTAPVLVPILSRKKHIERRVRMIAKFKPMSRIAAAASAVVLAVVAWVTLTGAADRPVPQKSETPPSVVPARPAEAKRDVLGLMKEELANSMRR